jgi:molecular chaperone GrpE
LSIWRFLNIIKKHLYKKFKDKMARKAKEKNSDKNPTTDNKKIEKLEAQVEEHQNQIEELEASLSESKDKYLRLFAEFDNAKKRNMKERFELMKNAAQDTLSALLPVLDDFDRAKKSADDENTQEVFSDGVSLVYNKLYTILKNRGLSPMESTGEDFDPELHEAITEIPAPTEEMKGKVIDTIETGYYLNDKIIRHAKVVVGK